MRARSIGLLFFLLNRHVVGLFEEDSGEDLTVELRGRCGLGCWSLFKCIRIVQASHKPLDRLVKRCQLYDR
jgi:hypothetical protein